MADADKVAVALGTSGTALMAAAGNVVFEAILNRFPPQATLVLAGPGNNGGDAYIVAEKLRQAGWPVTLASLVMQTTLKGDAAWAASHYRGETVSIGSIASLDRYPLIVDGLFGAGLSRPLDGEARRLIELINASSVDCVAIDVPSGIEGDSGQVLGTAPVCKLTVTFFRPKPGHLLLPGRTHCGELVVGDIGIGDSVLDAIQPTVFRNGPALWRQAWRPAASSDHKYTRGAVLVVAGVGMTGAARLAAAAARRVGAGLVSIAASDAATAQVLRGGEPGVIVREEDFASMLNDTRLAGVLLGPGGGLSPTLRGNVLKALRRGVPTVLDADALTVFADRPADLFDAIAGPCLLTPHEGEFTRIFKSIQNNSNKLDKVKVAARLSGATVLLKGADTVIVSPSGEAVINDNAPPSLATAGSGDVLAGFAVGLLGQGLTPLAAGCAATWIHGAAASRGGKRLIAEDLLVTDFAHIGL
jgi:NAD(P)H-hydrate epimerase